MVVIGEKIWRVKRPDDNRQQREQETSCNPKLRRPRFQPALRCRGVEMYQTQSPRGHSAYSRVNQAPGNCRKVFGGPKRSQPRTDRTPHNRAHRTELAMLPETTNGVPRASYSTSDDTTVAPPWRLCWPSHVPKVREEPPFPAKP